MVLLFIALTVDSALPEKKQNKIKGINKDQLRCMTVAGQICVSYTAHL